MATYTEEQKKGVEDINKTISNINLLSGQGFNELEPLMISTEQGVDAVSKAKETEKLINPEPTQPIEPTKPTAPAGTTLSRDDAFRLFGQDFTGLTANPDGSFTPDSSALARIKPPGSPTAPVAPEDAELAARKKELDDAKVNLSKYTISDAQLQNTVNDINSRFDARVGEMRNINERRKRAFETTGIRLGSRYTGGAGGSFGGIISEEERQGIARIGDLDSQRQSAILAAQEAQRKGNWEVYVKQVDLAEKAYDERRKEVAELNKKQKEQDDKLKEEAKKQSRKLAISDVIAQGITNRNEIYNIINYDESGKLVGDIDLKEIDEMLGELDKAGYSTDLKTYDELKKRGEIPEGQTFMQWSTQKKATESAADRNEEIRKKEYAAAQEVVTGAEANVTDEELASAIRSRATQLSDSDITAIVKARRAENKFVTPEYIRKEFSEESLEQSAKRNDYKKSGGFLGLGSVGDVDRFVNDFLLPKIGDLRARGLTDEEIDEKLDDFIYEEK